MDYFALDKSDEINEARRRTGYGKALRIAKQNKNIRTLHWLQKEKMGRKRKRKSQINNRKIHAESKKYFNEQSEIICNA